MTVTLGVNILGYRLATLDIHLDIPNTPPASPVDTVIKKFSKAWFARMNS